MEPLHIALGGRGAPPGLTGGTSFRIPQYRNRGPHLRYKGGLNDVGTV